MKELKIIKSKDNMLSEALNTRVEHIVEVNKIRRSNAHTPIEACPNIALPHLALELQPQLDILIRPPPLVGREPRRAQAYT